MIDLKGSVAVVTGGSRGIGRSIVLHLARARAKVVFSYASDLPSAKSLEAEVKRFEGEAIMVPAEFPKEFPCRIRAGIHRDLTHQGLKIEQHLIDIECGRPHHPTSGKHQQLFDKAFTTFSGLKRGLRDAPDTRAVLRSPQNQLKVAGDNG